MYVPERKYMLVSSYQDNRKQVFSGHETFPLRYGWLKKVYDEVSSHTSEEENTRVIFNDLKLISNFGVGKNMVSSMRHWSNYTNVINDIGVTSFANDIFSEDGSDPYMESPTTSWLMHYNIAKNPDLVTYHWFFNYYNGGAFDRKAINDELYDLCKKEGWKIPSLITIKRDIECFIRMYVSKNSSNINYSEDSIESPLSELSLIKQINSQGFYMPNRGSKTNLSTTLACYILLDFWISKHYQESSISFESMLYDPGSIGRIFLLDEESLMLLIEKISNEFSSAIIWTETAGMKQFSKVASASLEEVRLEVYKLLLKEMKNYEIK
jgi:hypothetical protein